MTLPDSRRFKSAAYAHLAEVGRALSNATRIEILELLAQAPRTVEVLASEVDQSVANTSHHLQVLLRAQLVVRERDGLYAIYALASAEVSALLAQVQRVAQRHVAALERLQRDFFAERDGMEPLGPEALLERLRDGSVVLIDVRPEREYAEGHLPGALSIPLAQLESRLAELPPDRAIVAYCRGPYCALSADAARRLRALGYDARRSDITPASLLGREER